MILEISYSTITPIKYSITLRTFKTYRYFNYHSLINISMNQYFGKWCQCRKEQDGDGTVESTQSGKLQLNWCWFNFHTPLVLP